MSTKPVAFAGMFYAIAAYTMWGIAPLYFKQITEVPPTDILMHRVIWSALLLCVLLVALKQIGKMKAIFASKKLIFSLAAASVLLGANWLLFIWAINSNYMLEASLGYYINPIINVFLGRLILQERLRPLQKFAVLLAIAGVVNIIVAHGT
ncbi:MAG: EamA family transporter RarD, partial [Pseudomonadota bacterium]|nr:EamA family transporter RarD [Pseudomonadota bacterium]